MGEIENEAKKDEEGECANEDIATSVKKRLKHSHYISGRV